MKKNSLFICFMLFFSNLSAQKIYTIDECKQMAMENNRKIKSSTMEISVSEHAQKEAFTNYFPSLSATGLGFKAKDPFVSMNMDGTPVTFLDDGLTGSIMLSQPVFVGGKIVYGNKLSKLALNVSRQQLRLSENEVMLHVENLYWELISLYEKVNTINILDELLTSLYADVEISFKAGLITRNDLLEVKLKQNSLKSNKIDLENGIKLCKMSLCQLIGIDITGYEDFDIAKKSIEKVDNPELYYIDHFEAMENRAEKKLLEDNVKIAKYQTKMKRADYLPSVAVGAAYFKHNFMDKWEGNSAAFISVSIPITDWWKGSHAIKQQKIKKQIAVNNKIDTQEQLLIQMQNIRNELDKAYRQLLIEEESIEQANENLRINKDNYKAGIINMSDLLNAQSILQQCRDKRAEAFASYQKKRCEYLQVTGR